jgi:hypothetical protein
LITCDGPLILPRLLPFRPASPTGTTGPFADPPRGKVRRQRGLARGRRRRLNLVRAADALVSHYLYQAGLRPPRLIAVVGHTARHGHGSPMHMPLAWRRENNDWPACPMSATRRPPRHNLRAQVSTSAGTARPNSSLSRKPRQAAGKASDGKPRQTANETTNPLQGAEHRSVYPGRGWVIRPLTCGSVSSAPWY